MITLNVYSFHRNIPSHRFDAHNTKHLLEILSKKYNIVWHNLDGQDKFRYKNDCDILIDQGSIVIFEFDDTKEFKTFDFGDAPTLSVQLSKSKNFIGAAIGQYNKTLWDETITDLELRSNVTPSIYPEQCWNLGIENYKQIQEYRNSIELDKRLYWRGSVYKNPNQVEYNRRISIDYISDKLSDFYFGDTPIPFDHYIQESINFKLALCFGVGGGYTCGDICLRDIEMYGLGIPTIRPTYAVELNDPLIPNVHYIAVDCEFDNTFRYKEPELLADKIIQRYNEVITDDSLLKEISDNAREWYIRNASGPNITNKIVNILGL